MFNMDEKLRLVLDMRRVWERIPNKYEFIVVAAKRAHEIAREAMETNRILPEKPIFTGARDVLEGRVRYRKK